MLVLINSVADGDRSFGDIRSPEIYKIHGTRVHLGTLNLKGVLWLCEYW